MRSGLIVKKVGMTRLYLEDGTHVPVTVLSLKDCQVIANQSMEKNGYNSITLATGEAKPKNTNKSQREAFAKVKVTPKQKQMEFRVSEENMVPIGSELGANHFIVGQYVDATGITIGKGFAGAMKRHNFGGLRASHGVSISHRSHGSTGNSQDPGRVFKGKKMAGQMGNRQRTIQNLQVVAADEERGLIFVKGGLPGSKGSWISLKDAVKKALPSEAPYPAGIKGANNTKIDDQNSKAAEKDVKEETAKVEAPVEEVVAEMPVEEKAKAESPVEEVATETSAEATPTSEDSANAEDNKKKED
jgi:large subunit ribosomal protein L3